MYMYMYLFFFFFLTPELIFTEVPPPGTPENYKVSVETFPSVLFFYFFFVSINIRAGTYSFLVSNSNRMRLLLRLFSSGNIIPEKPLNPFPTPGNECTRALSTHANCNISRKILELLSAFGLILWSRTFVNSTVMFLLRLLSRDHLKFRLLAFSVRFVVGRCLFSKYTDHYYIITNYTVNTISYNHVYVN